MSCHSNRVTDILMEGNSNQVVHYIVEEDQSSTCSSVLKRPPSWGVKHASHTGIVGIAAVDPTHGPSLDYFNLINSSLSEGLHTVEAYST